MAGRTVRVAIQCGALNSDTPFRTTCVMFKIKGAISCKRLTLKCSPRLVCIFVHKTTVHQTTLESDVRDSDLTLGQYVDRYRMDMYRAYRTWPPEIAQRNMIIDMAGKY